MWSHAGGAPAGASAGAPACGGKVGEPVARLVIADSACFWVKPGHPDRPPPGLPLVESESPSRRAGRSRSPWSPGGTFPGWRRWHRAPTTFTWPLLVRGPDDAGTTGSVSLTFAVP